MGDNSNGQSVYKNPVSGEISYNSSEAAAYIEYTLNAPDDAQSGEELSTAGTVNDVLDGFGGALGYMGKTNIGSNGKLYFETPNGGVFRGNQYVKTTSLAKYGGKIAKFTGPLGHVINLGQVGYGVYQDGGNFGKNAQKATAGAIGGMAGAWAGAEVGAAGGAALGGAIGIWFFGVGAIPGAAIGGFIGGLGGAISGGYYGSNLGESLIK